MNASPGLEKLGFVRKPTEQEDTILKSASIPSEMIPVLPRIIQTPRDPPSEFPPWGLLSFVYIPPEKRKNPKMYGYIKMRSGRWKSKDEAVKAAEKYVREVDSLNRYWVIREGESIILSDSPEYSETTKKVNMVKEETAAAQLDSESRKVLDTKMLDSRETFEIAEKQLKDTDEEEERAQWNRIKAMRDEADKMIEPDTLEHYTMLRSSVNNQLIIYKKAYEAWQDAIKLKEKIERNMREIRDMDVKYPTYSTQWKDKEMAALKEAGMTQFEPNTELLEPDEYCKGGNIVVREKRKDGEEPPQLSIESVPK